MRSWLKSAALCLLCCALLLAPAGCGSAPEAQEATPVLSSAPDDVQQPTPQPSQLPLTESAPVFGVPSEEPSSTDSTPAPIPDEEVTMTYTVGEEELTVLAIFHRSALGYSIIYDTEHYARVSFSDSDSYHAGEGNYLAVSLIPDLPLDDVIAGLRLQENILMEPELTAVGAGEYIAYTLYFTNEAGLYRQFWIMDNGSAVMLVEQSYDTVSDSAALYRAGLLAMLETLSILP